jgi:hypothetical protein
MTPSGILRLMTPVTSLTLVTSLALATPAVAQREQAALVDASMYIDPLATSDPCVIQSVLIDVQDILAPEGTNWISYRVSAFNTCTNEWLHEYLAPPQYEGFRQPISESDFDASTGYARGDLVATLTAFDYVTNTETPIHFDLHWSTPPGASDDSFAVIGTITTQDLVVVLDESINWNPWGSELGLPWAGMWLCNSRGCVGQGVIGS